MFITRYKNPGELSSTLKRHLYRLSLDGERFADDRLVGFMWPTILQWDAAKRKRTNGRVRAWGGEDVWVSLRPRKGTAAPWPKGYVQYVQRSYILRRDYYICVAFNDGVRDPMGWCVLDFDDCFNVYVDPKYRGCGVGRHLAARFAQALRVRRVGFQADNSQRLMEYATRDMPHKSLPFRQHF